MSKSVSDQINVNTILLLVVGALVTLGVKKADAAFTEIVRLQVEHEEMSRRVSNIETTIGTIIIPAKIK